MSNNITNQEIYEKLEEVRLLLRQQLAAFKVVNRDTLERGRTALLEDETRRKVFDLCDKRHTVNQIAGAVFPGKPLKTSQPTISYHLSLLEEYGIVAYEDTAGQRYYYKIRG